MEFLAGSEALLLHQGSSGFVSCSTLLTRLDNEDQFSYLRINEDDSAVSAIMESNIEGTELDATALLTKKGSHKCCY